MDLLKWRRVTVCWPIGFVLAGLLVVLGNLGSSEASAGSPVDDPEDSLQMMRLIKVEEKRSTSSNRNNASTVQNSNKHVLALTFKTVGENAVATSGGETGGLPGGSSSSSSTSTTGLTGSSPELPGGIMMLEPLEPEEPEEPPTTTSTTSTATTTATTSTTSTTSTTATTSTTGSTSGGGGSETFIGYYFYVESPGEMAPGGAYAATTYDFDHIAPLDFLGSGLRKQFNLGEEVVVHLASDAALASGSLKVLVETHVQTHILDDPMTPEDEEEWHAASTFDEVEYDITKYLCQDSSIDTRKAYGTPNRDGELPDDPNALPATLNFGGSVWKGGTFVGNMPWQTRDQSGLARAQIYPQGTSGRTNPIRMAALSMFYRGTAPNVTTPVTIAAFTPASNDPNFSVGANSVTWDTRWNIVPQATPDGPRDPSKDPLFRVPFGSSTPVNEYATWTLTDTMAESSFTPETVLSAIALAIHDESTFTSAAWRYFASDHFPAEVANEFPNNDSMPRLWIVETASAYGYYVDWY